MPKRTTLPRLTATAPTGRVPFLVGDEAAEQQAAIKSADRYIAEQYPAVAALLAEPAGLLTEAQRTLTYDEGLGAWRTAPVESAARDIDDIASDSENAQTPLFAAEVVVTDWKRLAPVQQEDGLFGPGGTVDGRFTELWFHYGTSTGTVTPAKAREIVAEMRGFAARLEALCDRADEIAADDYEARG
ncbi:hypothetical protein [Streptomyces sp. NPDC052701]|uniref:hypothetical protein n=1 Tax=Streptomyces sp. NPDC052701 TaxID=3155533 RepID=UPI00341CC49B